MKKLISYVLMVVSVILFNGKESSGQAHLHIARLDSFPQLPGDTAHEFQVYHNIRIVVTNTGNTNFFGDIHVYLHSQSLGITDTLVEGPHPPYLLLPGDTVSIHANPNYRFSSTVYAAGDNIIVVWPFSTGTTFDVLQTHVFFQMTVGIPEPDLNDRYINSSIVSQVLHLRYLDENKVERVRIYDLVGREVLNLRGAVNVISLAGFNSGLYFIELIQKDGIHAVKKILVSGN
jgi:hypothetical protein